MTKITVVCYEEGHENDILVYTVDVHNPQDREEVTTTLQEDMGDAVEPMHVLFAFAGDVPVFADWRE